MSDLTSVRLAACCSILLASVAGAQVVLIGFDNVPGVAWSAGPVPPAAFLNNYFLPQGVYFNSPGGGIAIASGSNVSAPNCAGPTNVGPIWDWTQPTTTCFWFNGAPAVVDSVAVTFTSSTSPTTLTAYDFNGAVLGSTSGGGSAVLSLNFPGAIRSARLSGGPYAFDDFTFNGLTPLGVGGPMTIPVTALIQPANGGPAATHLIGTLSVATGAGSSIIASLAFAPGWGQLDDCYDFQWVNVETTRTVNCLTQTSDQALGSLPAIQPGPSDGPEPFFFNQAQWSSGVVGGFIVRQEQIASTFLAAPSGFPTDPSIIGFATYLVATDVTGGTIPANHFCVLAGFSWSYRSTSNDVSLGVPVPASATTINAALANGLLPGSPSAPGFIGWLAQTSSALFECPLLAASPSTISVAAGGTQTMALNAGRNSANSLYLVVGSTSGTSPGTFVGPVFVPLNTPDFYFTFTLNTPNSPFLPDSAGFLDSNGHALTHLILPPGLPASLAGVTVNHAYGAVTPAGILVSNPSSLLLVP